MTSIKAGDPSQRRYASLPCSPQPTAADQHSIRPQFGGQRESNASKNAHGAHSVTMPCAGKAENRASSAHGLVAARWLVCAKTAVRGMRL